MLDLFLCRIVESLLVDGMFNSDLFLSMYLKILDNLIRYLYNEFLIIQIYILG